MKTGEFRVEPKVENGAANEEEENEDQKEDAETATANATTATPPFLGVERRWENRFSWRWSKPRLDGRGAWVFVSRWLLENRFQRRLGHCLDNRSINILGLSEIRQQGCNIQGKVMNE